MATPGKSRHTAQRCLIYSNVCFLVAYFFSFCTLSPQVHAETLRHHGPLPSAAATHCSPLTAASAPPQHPPHEPLCCEVRGGSNKAILTVTSLLSTGLLPGWFALPIPEPVPHAPRWLSSAWRRFRP